MGRTSKELKELKERKDAQYPVEGKDYYIERVKVGDTAMSGWVGRYRKKSSFTRDNILTCLKTVQPREKLYNPWYVHYFLYPGPKPDKKWGPVCP